jgi:hypothetical protein
VENGNTNQQQKQKQGLKLTAEEKEEREAKEREREAKEKRADERRHVVQAKWKRRQQQRHAKDSALALALLHSPRAAQRFEEVGRRLEEGVGVGAESQARNKQAPSLASATTLPRPGELALWLNFVEVKKKKRGGGG